MKKLFILLAFIITSCVSQDTTTYLGGTYDHEGNCPQKIINITEAIRKEWAPNATIYIVYDQPLAYGIIGLANKIGPHSYLIQYSSNNPDPEATLFHEMGHIIDSEQGRLRFITPMSWNGIECDFMIPWHERPWEISANEWRDCLIYDYNNRLLEHYDYALEDWLESYPVNLIWLK